MKIKRYKLTMKEGSQ